MNRTCVLLILGMDIDKLLGYHVHVFVLGRAFMNKANYRIKKVMNNNIILAYDLVRRSEKIIIGKGIGFNQKQDSKVYIPDKAIQKAFTADEKKMRREYFRLVEKTDDMIIAVCEKIIGEAETELGELNNYIHILLIDHVNFAIQRTREGMKIDNPLNEEIRVLFPKEFEIATEGIKLIKRVLGVYLGEGEIGFIAMHLNSARNNVNVKETVKYARVMNEIVREIQNILEIKIDKNGYEYRRLVNHIHGTILRVKKGKCIDNPILTELKVKFEDSFKSVKKVKDIIEKEYEVKISSEELGYLVLHIERLREN